MNDFRNLFEHASAVETHNEGTSGTFRDQFIAAQSMSNAGDINGILSLVSANISDPEEAQAVAGMTYTLAKTYNQKPIDILKDLDGWAARYNGATQPRKTAWKQIQDGFVSGWYTDQLGTYGSALMYDQKPEVRQMYLDKIAEIKSRMPNTEGDKGNLGVKALASASNLVGTMIRPLLVNTAVSALIPAIKLPMVATELAGAVPAIAKKVASHAVSFGTTWAVTADVEAGNIYLDMLDNGVDEDIAKKYARVHGAIAGALEAAPLELAFTRFPFLKTAAQRAFVQLGTNTRAKQAVVKTLGGILQKNLISAPMQVLAETATEALQEVSSIAFEKRAALALADEVKDEKLRKMLPEVYSEWRELYNQEVGDREANYEGKEYKDYVADRVWDVVVQTALGTGVLSFLGTAGQTIADARYTKSLRTEAEVDPSKVHFIKKHFQDDQLKDINASDRGEALAQIYDSHHTGETVSSVDTRTIDTDYIPINENLAEGEEEQASKSPLKPIQRRKDNRLHTQEMIGSEKNPAVIRHNDGSESHTLLLGTADVTAKENNRYGYIDYTISPDYQKVTIDDVMMKPGQESLTGEFITELMRRYPGLEIEWSPETDAQKKIKEELIANNTENPGKLQMFKRNQSDMDKILKVAGYIKKIAPNVNSDEAATISAIFSWQANKAKVSLEEFVENKMQLKTFQQGIADNDFTEQEKAEILSGTKKGAFKPSPLGVAKGIIYVGENGDASTFLHEAVHGAVVLDPEAAREVAAGLQEYIKQNPEGFKKYLQDHAEIMKGTDIVNANKELDIERFFSEIENMADPLKWNANQHEIVAVIAETNFQEGQTFDPRLKTLFDKIIDFFLRIYRTLKKRSKLNDRTIKAYDRLIAGNPELKAKMDAMETTENQGVRSETLKAGETPSAEFTFKNPVEMDAETVAIGGGIEQAVNALRGYTLEDGTIPDGLIIHDGGNATYVRLDNQKGQTSNALSTREAAIRKYTDKSRYSSENIYGDVYVDDRRVEQAGISDQAREEYEKELEAAKRFSKRFNCEVFLLPEGDENGNAVYVDKHKNPDAIIQGYFVDFKQAKGTDGSVTRQFVRGLGQAEGVVLTVGNGTSISDAVHWINGKLNSLKKTYDGFIVIIEDYKGNYGTYSVNAKRLSVQENPFTTALGLSSPNLESENSQVNSNINPTDNSVNPQTYFQTNTPSRENDSILWQNKTPQEIEDELVAEARGSWTAEEWIDFAHNMMGSTIDDDTLRSYWDKANNVTETPEGQKVVNTENLSEEEKDKAFNALIDTEDGVRRVIEDIRNAIAFKDEVYTQGSAEEEERIRAEAIDKAVTDFESAAKIIRSVVYSREKDIDEKAIKSIQGIMRKNVTEYRDLYAKFTGRSELSLSNDAVPFIDEPTRAAVATMSISEKRRYLENIADEKLTESFLKGKELGEGETERVIKHIKETMAAKDKEIAEAQEKYSDAVKRINARDKMLLKDAEQREDLEKTVNRLSANIRAKLDKGQKISEEEYRKLNTAQDKLRNIQQMVTDLNKQTMTKEALKWSEKIKKLRAEQREDEKRLRAAQKLHKYKSGLVDYIQQKISKNVYWEQAEKIKALQALFGKPSKYDSQYITYNGSKMLLKEFKAGIEDGTISIPELSDYQLRRYLNKDIGEYTVEELEVMADTVRYLIQAGRQEWQAMVDARNYEAKQWQALIINQIVKHPRYTEASDSPLPGTAEDIKKERNLWNMIRTGWYKTLNMARKAQILDNDRKDVAYRLLVEERRDHLRNELEAVRKRMKPVLEFMAKLNVKAEDFYKDTYRLKIGPHEVTFNVSQLIYGVKSQMEQRNRDAFVYGNLFNAHEKPEGVNRQWLEKEGDIRVAEFNRQAEEILKGKENLMKVADAIWADWQDKDNFDRLNMAAIAEYNQAVDPVQFYMPIIRRDFNGTDLPSKIADDIYNQNAGKNMTSVESGMTKSRITIAPENQQPIDMDYFKLWNESVLDQEHFIETNAYVRKLNRVFKARGSKDLKAIIENVYGQGMKNDIDNYINEIANPDVNTDTQGVNKFITFLRGALYPAYLAFKSSSIILQMITSPAPFLREVGPVELAKGLVQMSLHPVETWKYVSGLSSIMEDRSMNPLLDEVKKAANNYTDPKYKRLWHKIQETGTMGLEMADRWSVTAGWLAVFTKKKNELIAGGMEEKLAERDAVKYADNVVLETQPTGDKAELAPLFKMGGPAWQAFTQFQVSLNVIWNNLTYDVAFSDRYNHEMRKAAGTLIGYALAGVILYSVQEGFDDDDDAEDVILKLLYGATTQYTSSIPLVSSSIDNMARSWMTGDSWTSRSNQLYPGFDTLMQGATNLDMGKIARGAALMVGVPVSGYKEFEHAFYNRKTGEKRFYPKAFLGQREDTKKKKK